MEAGDSIEVAPAHVETRGAVLWHGSCVLSDDALDRLYGLSLAEFTPARDELARDLRKAGEREAADEAKALAKPSISAWAVNQLARKEPMQIRGLMTAGERLRSAQAGVLLGGDPDELQAALQRQRDVVAALLDSAEHILATEGHPASQATLDRIRGTLTAAAADEEGTRLVESGLLTKDLEPAGFGRLGPAEGKAPRRKSARSSRPRRTEERAKKQRVGEAQRELDELRAQVAEQKGLARRAASEARKAQAELERLTAQLEAAKDKLARARS
jgi:hypothetical protein